MANGTTVNQKKLIALKGKKGAEISFTPPTDNFGPVVDAVVLYRGRSRELGPANVPILHEVALAKAIEIDTEIMREKLAAWNEEARAIARETTRPIPHKVIGDYDPDAISDPPKKRSRKEKATQ